MLVTRRHALAGAVLLAAWGGFALVIWAIIAYEPPGVATHLYLPGIAIGTAVSVGLVASLRLQWVWRLGFTTSLPVPGWAVLAAVGATAAAVVVSFIGPMTAASAVWLAVMTAGVAYAAAAGADHRWLTRATRWPVWIAVVGGGLLVTVVGLGAIVEGTSLLTVVFFLALLLFAYHVLFVLPMTLRESMRPPAPAPERWPAVSVLIPAYQEAGVVGDCIESVLGLDYPVDRLEIVVIDDGSTDGTHAEAAMYRSELVRVVRRANGGKHAALNFGLQCTSNPVVVTVDADSRPAPTALKRMVAQLLDDDELGALSAAVIPLNDGGLIGGLQRLEYAVSNTNRRAYSAFAAVPVVPGCFGVYRREALDAVWGFDPDTVTEDFDVTVSLLRDGWAVRHGAATVWTIAPDGWGALWRQRLRWYRGGLEVIRKHWAVLSTPSYGYVHGLTLPARTVSQVFSPVASYVILLAVVWGLIAAPSLYLLVLLGLFFVLTVLIGLYSVVLEEEPLWTLAYAPLLFVGYKHLIDASVAVGSIGALVGDVGSWSVTRPDRGVGAD